MRYRTKLLLCFLVTAVLSKGLSMAILYGLSRHYLFEEYRAKVLSIAATIASLLDGDLHKTIQSRTDESSEAYAKLQQQLRRARDANRRGDTYVRYVFTIRRAPQDASVLQVLVDPEEGLEDTAHVGDVYHSSERKSMVLDRLEADRDFTTDEWGRWLAANAPVNGGAGQNLRFISMKPSGERVVIAQSPRNGLALFTEAPDPGRSASRRDHLPDSAGSSSRQTFEP
jgi:hypothetical protein